MLKSLNSLKYVRKFMVTVRYFYLTRVWGMNIDRTAEFSLSTRFDRTYPRGVHVGPESYIALEAMVLTHDTTRRLYSATHIGRRCFVGARALIMPGITIGDESIVAAGAVVTKDVPSRCIVAGNPAKIVRKDIKVGPYGRLESTR